MTLSRRTLLKTVSYASLSLPLLSPKLLRAASANGKLNIACVGTASQARFSIDNLRGENLVAFADVDASNLAKAGMDFPGAKLYKDYRELFDKEQKNFEAAAVAIPDHHHAQAGLRAMALGKHLYCEKPLAHSVQEVQLMIDMAKKNKLATQMGTQIHATDNYRRVVELIQGGAIGTVKEVHVWLLGAMYQGPRLPEAADPVPPTLDWDLWLGPAATRDYHDKVYHPFNWRGWWDFGGGGTSDMACHWVDLPHWALGLRQPHTVRCTGPEPEPLRPPRSSMIEMHHAAAGDRPAVTVTWHLGGTHVDKINVYKKFNIDDKNEKYRGSKTCFVGEKGILLADYGRHDLLPEEPFKDFKAPAPTIPNSIGHHAEWIKACKEGTPTTCNFEYSGALTQAVLLGIVSHRAGNVEIKFDHAKLKTDNDKANAFLTKPYRAGWEIEKLV
jgi:predicted dehydrogenase